MTLKEELWEIKYEHPEVILGWVEGKLRKRFQEGRASKEKEMQYDLEKTYNKAIEMLNNLPENRPLYKDSGLWQIRSDDMGTVLFQQGVNESLGDFITRVTQLKEKK